MRASPPRKRTPHHAHHDVPMKQQRQARIDHEIQRALAKIIGEDLKDPRLGFVTVVRCEITQDMKFCKVFVSIIGDRHVARQSMDALESASRYLRGELGHAIDLRYTPELTFVEDRTTERAIALHKTLEKAKVVDE
jgi:ribosome-binding factor A